MENYEANILDVLNTYSLKKEELQKVTDFITNLSNEIDKDGFDKIVYLLEDYLYPTNDIKKIMNIMENYDDMLIIHKNMTMTDIAENYVEECWEIEPPQSYYVDYERLGEDMRINGNYDEIGSDIYEYIG